MTPHGLMFHHFHDEGDHIQSQGSISADEFEKIISLYQKNFNVLSAEDWYEKAVNGTLGGKDVCITLDDGLKCQYEIALPILRKLNLKAFWFIYTSPAAEGKSLKTELYRYFRFKNFKDVEEFYEAFKKKLFLSSYAEIALEALEKFNPKESMKEYPFYTDSDKEFRFLRDQVLKCERYEELMDSMVLESIFAAEVLNKLWMSRYEIAELSNSGHIVGLHSHSHPTHIPNLTSDEQNMEYKKNYESLKEICNQTINTMSHPCGVYTKDTLKILESFGIKVGFRDNMEIKKYGMLEFPRYDHTYLIKEVR